MKTTLLKNTASVDLKSSFKTQNNRLVARWLIDENSKPYCQWVREN